MHLMLYDTVYDTDDTDFTQLNSKIIELILFGFGLILNPH